MCGLYTGIAQRVVCVIISICAYGWLYIFFGVFMHVFLLWVLTAIKFWKKAVIWLAVAHARCHELKALLTYKYAKDTFNKKKGAKGY